MRGKRKLASDIQGGSMMEIDEAEEQKPKNDETWGDSTNTTRGDGAKEIFWAQKARSIWLKEGDKNRAYFHACVKTRRKRNKITSLQKENGEWCTDNQQIVQEICKYYEDMYTTSQPQNMEEVLEGVPVSVTSRLNQNLIQPVEENEVRAAVFSMHPNKAPRPDDDSLFCCKAHPQEARAMQEILAKLPKGLCAEICGHMAKFWRGQNEEERKMQWISWEKITQPDLLVSKVLGAKYKLSQTGWEGEAPRNASWIWRSIYSSCSVLQKGMWKRVGDGTTINIWRDKWLMGSSTGKIATQKPPGYGLLEILKIRNIYSEIWICSRKGGKGSPICKCCGEEEETVEHIIFFCNNAEPIWKLAPIQWDGLLQWRSNFWRWWEGILKARKRLKGEDHITLTANIIWQIWKARNARRYEGKYGDHMSILDNAKNEWLEFQEEQMDNDEKHRTGTGHQMQNHQWRPPDAGVVKISTDAAVSTKLARAGLGMIAKDCYGNLVEARGIRKYSNCGAEIEEANAIQQGLIMTTEAGWQRIEMQFDCKAAIEKIHKRGMEESPIATIMEDIRQLSDMFQYCTFSFVYKDGNRCAHKMAQFATRLVSNVIWKQSFPMWLKESIHEDNKTNVHVCN
ncbi:uncharacterized protein [Coffea arabica]|uniref:RNase H type-1 domain-containing protein n=1 Tax=Coffea arabica TaxID=13443 RepID=A0ABM4WMS3_COFAR